MPKFNKSITLFEEAKIIVPVYLTNLWSELSSSFLTLYHWYHWCNIGTPIGTKIGTNWDKHVYLILRTQETTFEGTLEST